MIMKRIFSLLAISVACMLFDSHAFAHAFLDHAVPGVGMTIAAAPAELDLTFTEDIVPAFSGARVAHASGAAVATGRPTFGPANTMHLRAARPLTPGTYVVTWHVVSVDTHHTQGTYKFTVAP
jgi:methionine-rich copper-binding protein CopC